MSLTEIAVSRNRFTLLAALALFIAGIAALIDFPATEEPTVPVRTAVVEAYLPGAQAERVEALIAKPLEDQIRRLPEVEHIEAAIRPGALYMTVALYEGTAPDRVSDVWRRLRDRVADAARQFPEGAIPPVVNDEWGRVSVTTLALTGPDYSSGQLHEMARNVRNRLQTVAGVEQISLHGVRDEVIYIEVQPARLAAAGLSIEAVMKAVSDHNAVSGAGELQLSGQSLQIDASGRLRDAAAVGAVLVTLPDGGALPLSALAEISLRTQEPAPVSAYSNGDPTVVLAVSMRSGLNVVSFAERLNIAITETGATLPAGATLARVTEQADVVSASLNKVGKIFLETAVIVLGVVVVFLGWRAGLVTSVIVPLTTLGTLLIMRLLGVELHQVSIGAIIIALGIFVDNAIVVVEDYQRRLGDGEPANDAALNAGRSMASPLLISSLAIILAFGPLVAGSTVVAEYMRSLGVVMAVTLLLSLFVALTVIAVLCKLVIHAPQKADIRKDWIGRIRLRYASLVERVVKHPALVSLAMAALLGGAIAAGAGLPQTLLPASDRDQIQMLIDLPPGTGSETTMSMAKAISARMADTEAHPDITRNVVYGGDGGPRFILGLNPPLPAAHRAYAVINLRKDADTTEVLSRLRNDLGERFPQARVEPKRFSMGASEAGGAVFILNGADREALSRAADQLIAGLHRESGMIDIRDDREALIPALQIIVDPARAAAVRTNPSEIARALQAAYEGVQLTTLNRGELFTPVVLRAEPSVRLSPEAMAATPLNADATLGQVARISLMDQPSLLNRRNQLTTITVSARHESLTAQEIVNRMSPVLAQLDLPPGGALKLGGEIEESELTNAGLVTYLPMALLGMTGLFLWQFGSVRMTVIVMASIPFVYIGATLGLYLTGQPMSFTATLGLLALAGIIVNNGVLLLERVVHERKAGLGPLEAVRQAAEIRLRPIVMTKLTCIIGLLPLFLFGGALWRPMAAAMMGGLALGTLITLVLIPALYALFFDRLPQLRKTPRPYPPAETS